MNKEEIQEQIQELVSPHFTVCGIESVNFEPHPFMVGTRHVGHASEKFGGMLGEAAIESAERAGIYCAHPGCNLTYAKHKCDKVCMLQLTDNISNKVAVDTLGKIKQLLQDNDIDGITLIETEQKFRIGEPLPEDAPEVLFSEEKYRELTAAYKEAVTAMKDSFTFDDKEYEVGHALQILKTLKDKYD